MGKATNPDFGELEVDRDQQLSQAAGELGEAVSRIVGNTNPGALSPHEKRERDRVKAILERDKATASEDAARKAALLDIGNKVYVSVSDAVIPPTPEWLAKNETRPVTVQADGQGHHARSVKTVRRVITSHATRAHAAGKIDDRQLRACTWYRDRHEETGLDGRVAISSFEPRIASGMMGGAAFTDRQVEAMDDMRKARAAITAKYRRFFDLVVLQEIGVKRAERLAKCRRDSGMLTLRTCADQVADWLGL